MFLLFITILPVHIIITVSTHSFKYWLAFFIWFNGGGQVATMSWTARKLQRRKNVEVISIQNAEIVLLIYRATNKYKIIQTYKTNKYSAVIVIILPAMGRLEACPLSCIPSCLHINQIAIKRNYNHFLQKVRVKYS